MFTRMFSPGTAPAPCRREIVLRRPWLHFLDRAKSQAKDLAEHRGSRNAAQMGGNGCGRLAFGPECFELLDALIRPLASHSPLRTSRSTLSSHSRVTSDCQVTALEASRCAPDS